MAVSSARVGLRVAGPRGRRAARRASARCDAAADALGVLKGAKEVALSDGEVHDMTRKYYGETLSTSDDLRTSACKTPSAPARAVKDILKRVPTEVKAKYYGCGSPLPQGIEGLRVLDLGSGSGRDCYVASALVGAAGSVTGIDMTDEQLAVANAHAAEWEGELGYANMRFVKGQIEDISAAGVAAGSVDLIISNCVINLSPDKEAVLRGAWEALAPGGEFYFSDVYCDRRLTEAQRTDEICRGECLGGAMYVEDFKRLCQATGFTDPRVLEGHPIEITDPDLAELLGEAKFYSITYRLFKLPGQLETLCEDYGQYAVYKGTIPGSSSGYTLDDHHRFVTGKPMLVCGNTAAMVGEDGVSWLAPHFEVVGDRSMHYGLFDCGPSPVAAAPAASGGAADCGGGSCC